MAVPPTTKMVAEFTILSQCLRKARRNYFLSAGAQSLFYELLAICVEEDWPDTVHSFDNSMIAALNSNLKALRQAQQELVEAKLILYTPGKKANLPGKYYLSAKPTIVW